MKLKKANVLALGVVLSTSLTVGFSVNNRVNELNKQLATLNKVVDEKNNVIEELKDNNKALQNQLTEVSSNVQTIQQDVEEIKNWLASRSEIPLCGIQHSAFKSYMDYRCITSRSSTQYKLIQNGTIRVGSDGLLYCGEYVSVALGSRFGNVGDKFIITLDTGKAFKAIKGDEKADRDTANNCHHLSDGSLIEFVIDTRLAKQSYYDCIRDGDFNSSEKFNGHIVKIEKVISD